MKSILLSLLVVAFCGLWEVSRGAELKLHPGGALVPAETAEVAEARSRHQAAMIAAEEEEEEMVDEMEEKEGEEEMVEEEKEKRDGEEEMVEEGEEEMEEEEKEGEEEMVEEEKQVPAALSSQCIRARCRPQGCCVLPECSRFWRYVPLPLKGPPVKRGERQRR